MAWASTHETEIRSALVYAVTPMEYKKPQWFSIAVCMLPLNYLAVERWSRRGKGEQGLGAWFSLRMPFVSRLHALLSTVILMTLSSYRFHLLGLSGQFI
jgi:hypothetical protein